MRFLIDADLPRSAGQTVSQYGHEVIDVRDVGLRHAKDPVIAQYAIQQGLCLITGDQGFSDIRTYPPYRFPGLIVLFLPRSANSNYINKLLDNFLQQKEIIEQLPGKLAIVEPGRVRLRSK